MMTETKTYLYNPVSREGISVARRGGPASTARPVSAQRPMRIEFQTHAAITRKIRRASPGPNLKKKIASATVMSKKTGRIWKRMSWWDEVWRANSRNESAASAPRGERRDQETHLEQVIERRTSIQDPQDFACLLLRVPREREVE